MQFSRVKHCTDWRKLKSQSGKDVFSFSWFIYFHRLWKEFISVLSLTKRHRKNKSVPLCSRVRHSKQISCTFFIIKTTYNWFLSITLNIHFRTSHSRIWGLGAGTCLEYVLVLASFFSAYRRWSDSSPCGCFRIALHLWDSFAILPQHS